MNIVSRRLQPEPELIVSAKPAITTTIKQALPLNPGELATKRTKRSLLFLLWMLLLPALAANADGLVVDDVITRTVLDRHLDFVYDKQQTYQVIQVVEDSDTLPWQSGEVRDSSMLMTAGLYWFKGTLVNNSSEALQYTLEVEYPSINIADLYVFYPDGDVKTVYTDAGLNDRFSNRPTPHRNLVNTLTIPANSSITLVWRIESQPLFQFRATLWDTDAYIAQDQHFQMLHGMVYGVLLVMALYNLFLFFSTREQSYFFYVAYVLSFAYILAADRGHLYQYVASDESWAKLPIYALAYVTNILMFGQFTIYFLNLRKRERRLLWLIRWLAVISTLLVAAVVMTNSMIFVVLGLTGISLMYIAALVAGVVVRRAGVISAGHYVIAIMILVFSLIASNMATLGLISSSEAIENIGSIGTTLMLIFFSLALADRINQLQKENSEANIGMARSNAEKIKAQVELQNSKNERVKLEQSSSQAKLESRAKSDFLATLSHEIRTPMNGVLGMTELMKATDLSGQQTYYLNTIEHSGQSLLAIVNDLQDFAKIEAGKMELEPSSFNLETLLDDCISTFALRAVEKNLTFIADLDPSIDPVLRGDASKLQQIILNLLSNAFKFTDQGTILISVKPTQKSAVNCVELCFEVQDSGIGLTDDERQRLFTPFQHADDSTYGRYGGSGLGLAISKQLAELMDGSIGVTSETGVGSTFWFTARFIREEQPDPALLRQKSSRLIGQKLLLVDSNQQSRQIIERLLRSWSMDVIAVSSASQALEAFAGRRHSENAFNLILCDYNLEDGDGLSLAKQLRKVDQSTVFVLMATNRQLENQSELEQCGISILLEKPMTTALLHDGLKRSISSQYLNIDEQALAENDANPIKVLVAEDNQVNQMVIKGLFKQLHIDPDFAADGLEAVRAFEARDYDLILMDCEMPEMDGYEASHQIREKEKRLGRSPVTIIALSAHARSDYKDRAIKSGMNDYLTKPITLSELIKVTRPE